MTDTSHGQRCVPESVKQYVSGLHRKRMAAGVLFRDGHGRVLLVEPAYKPNWEIPGGAVEPGESPWAAAARELVEELGWVRHPQRLLVVDYVSPQDSRPEGVLYVFDGGWVTQEELAWTDFSDGEILSVGLYAFEQVRSKVKRLLADRLAAAVEAADQDVTVLCEQGRRVV